MNCWHSRSFKCTSSRAEGAFSQRLSVGCEPRGVAELLIGDDLHHGIVAQAVGIVGVFVSGDDLIDALSQQCQRIMAHAVILAQIAQACSPVAGQIMVLIEGAQRQQTGITGDPAPGKIGADGLMTVEGEAQLW